MRCWITRWQLSNALDRGDLAARLGRGHTAGCASCQSFGHALESLHGRLSRDAHTAAPPAPVVHRLRWPLVIGGPLLVGGAVAIALSIGTGGPVTPIPPPSIQASNPFVQVDRVRQVADRFSQVVARTPLEVELDDLISDGKRGLDVVLSTGSLR